MSPYLSSSWIVASRSNLYWNPEHPPPSTVTLKHVPFREISLSRLTQLSLIISASSCDSIAALVAKPTSLDDLALFRGDLRDFKSCLSVTLFEEFSENYKLSCVYLCVTWSCHTLLEIWQRKTYINKREKYRFDAKFEDNPHTAWRSFAMFLTSISWLWRPARKCCSWIFLKLRFQTTTAALVG